MGCVQSGLKTSGTPVSYSSRGSEHTAQQNWPPNEVTMPSPSSSQSPSSLTVSAKDKGKGKKGKEAVLSHKKHKWPKKMVTKIACRFCNEERKLELEWLTVDEFKEHYEKDHNDYANVSTKRTCKYCGNKFKNEADTKKHETNCEAEEWVREFEEED